MTERSATRRELELSIRALLPDELSLSRSMKSQTSTTAAAGVSGLLTGYVWGWIRGRRTRRKPRR